MTAYVIFDIDVHEPEVYEEYRRAATPTVHAHGGYFVVRGAAETWGGDWSPKRMVVIKFECMAKARTWYDSPEYQIARSILEKAASSRCVAVNGYVSSAATPALK